MKEILITLAVLLALVGGFMFYVSSRKKSVLDRLRSEYGELPDNEMHAEDFESIQQSYTYLKKSEDIDAITWNDLDLDAIYKQINATQSTHGDEWLYARLHKQNAQDVETLETYLRAFDTHEDIRVQLQYLLRQLGKKTGHDTHAFLRTINSQQDVKATRYFIQVMLLVLGIILLFILPQIGILLTFTMVFLNFLTKQANDSIRKSSEKVKFIASSIKSGQKIVTHLNLPEFEMMRNELEVAHTNTKPILRTAGFITTDAGMTNELTFFNEIISILFLVGPIAYSRSLKLVKEHREDIRALFEILGMIDGLIAIASYRRTLPQWCTPTYNTNGSFAFDTLVHPLLAHNQGVTNTGVLGPKLVFTGSNASGKSTFIKTLALNALLGQTINTCTAKTYEFQHAHLLTSMALRDSIQSGKSYFIVELESLKRIMDAVKVYDHCFIVVDEILRGTNTLERIAASSSILQSLGTSNASICVATHDIELTRILEGVYESHHFREHVTDDMITFDYKLYDGPSKTTNAIKLLSYMRFDKDIIDASTKKVETFRTKNTWES